MNVSKLALSAAVLLMASSAFAAGHNVHGYVRNDGTYVAPHYQSNPNSTKLDNYSTKGNVNPYTGASGTVDPYPNPYNQPRDSNSGYSRNGSSYGSTRDCTSIYSRC